MEESEPSKGAIPVVVSVKKRLLEPGDYFEFDFISRCRVVFQGIQRAESPKPFGSASEGPFAKLKINGFVGVFGCGQSVVQESFETFLVPEPSLSDYGRSSE